MLSRKRAGELSELTPSLVKTIRKVVDHGGAAKVSRHAVVEAVSRIVAAVAIQGASTRDRSE